MATKSKLKASNSEQIDDHSQALEEDIELSPNLSVPVRKSSRVNFGQTKQDKDILLSERNAGESATILHALPPHLQGEENFATPGLPIPGPQHTLQRSPVTFAGSSALPVGTMNSVKMAARLAPHIAASPTAIEREIRHEAALASMRAQLQSQQIIIDQQKQMQEVQKEAFQAFVLSSQVSPATVIDISSGSSSPSRKASKNASKQANSHISSGAQVPTYLDQHGLSPETLIFNQIASSELSVFRRQNKQECQRCGRAHEYTDQLCTNTLDVNGASCPQLSPRDTAWRSQTKLLLKLKQKHQTSWPKPLPLPSQATAPMTAAADRPLFRIFEAPIKRRNSVCGRCGRPHLQALCTATVHVNGDQLPDMAAEDYEYRIAVKLDIQREAKSAQAAQATTTSPRRQAKSSGKVFKKPTAAAMRKDLLKAEQAIISASRRRMQHLKVPSKTALRVSKRTQELQVAALTGDHELLDTVSDLIEDEQESEDDKQVQQEELATSTAFHNLMHPRAKQSIKTADGYTKSEFINDSEEQDEPDAEGAEDDDENVEDDEDEEDDEEDDDPSPTYEQTASRTPSPSKRVIPSERWRAFQAFERLGRQQAAAPAQTALTAPLDIAAIIAATIAAVTASAAHKPAIDLPAILQIVTAAKEPQIDAHGRHAQTSKLDIALHAPVHGAWDDIDHLVNVYMPLYDKYRTSAGSNNFETIWECYSTKQRECISRFLTTRDHDGKIIDDYSVDILSQLSNDDFTAVMCKTKGYSTAMLTEIELRKLPAIRTPLTTRSHWIDFESNWLGCLKKASKQGKLDAKRLTVIYRESIPDPFFQLNLLQQNFKTWEQCHAHMLLQIENHTFLVPWGIDAAERRARHSQPDSRAKPQQQGGAHGQQHQQQGSAHGQQHHQQQGGGAAKHGIPNSGTPATIQDGKFDPLQYKNSFGTQNVNPNLIVDLDLNPSKIICTRCTDTTHRWLTEMCTSYKNKAGAIIDKLSYEETNKRKLAKWKAGFFATTDPTKKAPRASPSVQHTAVQAQDSVNTLSQQRK